MYLNFQSNLLDDNFFLLATPKLTGESTSNRKPETKLRKKSETKTAKKDHGEDLEPKLLDNNLTLT